MSKVAIDDLWIRRDGVTPTARHGRGNRYRVRWTEMVAGVERTRTESFPDRRKKDAVALQEQLIAEKHGGRFTPRELMKTRFEVVADRYVASRPDLEVSSMSKLQDNLRIWLLPKWAGAEVGAITHADVENWSAELREGRAPHLYSGRAATTPSVGLSASHRSYLLSQLSAVFRYAKRHGLTSSNPATGIVREKIRKKVRVVPTGSQVRELAHVTPRDSDSLLIEFLALTGVRIGEALALKTDRIDLDRNRAHITETWKSAGNKEVLGAPKNGEIRWIAFPPSLRARLAHLVEGRGAGAFVFAAPRGGAWNRRNWTTRVFNPAKKAAQLDAIQGFTPHALRHTYATWAISGIGADVKTVQVQMGHRSPSITLNLYSDLWPDRLDEVANALDEMWAQTRAG